MKFEDVENKIREISASSLNSMKLLDLAAFAAPLIGISSGDDQLFAKYKDDIGGFLLLPNEWLELKYGVPFDPAGISVISWALPQTEDTKQKMKNETQFPNFEWSLARTFGEEFNRKLQILMEGFFEENQVQSVAPSCNKDFRLEESPKYGFASNWSERHTAYISGLGTFGLCDGLITEAGKAARFGSIIVNCKFPVSGRKYSNYREYCLVDQGCKVCSKRCPTGAITENGHDKVKCSKYLYGTIPVYAKEKYGFEGQYGCGMCQTKVPCASCNPKRRI